MIDDERDIRDVLRDTSLVGRMPVPDHLQKEAQDGSISLFMGEAWTENAQYDHDTVLSGRRVPLKTEFVRKFLRDRGVNELGLHQLRGDQRARLANALVRTARAALKDKHDSISAQIGAAGPTPGGLRQEQLGDAISLRGAGMSTILSGGRDNDVVCLDEKSNVEVNVAALRKILLDAHDLTPEQYAALPKAYQHKISKEMLRIVNRATRDLRNEGQPARNDEARRARSELHVWLRDWAEGPLTLEHPQGSSYHHLIDYDDKCAAILVGESGRSLRDIDEEHGSPQIFVVERDWARAFSGYDLAKGESPLPFPSCCFEFRISGVRVLAMHRESEGQTYMFCVYGRGGSWVADDYGYWIDDGTFRSTKVVSDRRDAHEFPRVARLVHDNVRVACIMVDAEVAERERRVVSDTPLARKRVREGRPPPRDHYVMDLKKSHRPSATHRAGGGEVGGTRTPQRGHFRRGTWVHYDDTDSGQVQYADEGGFWHSRTWRRWHFAGDPNNLITKEYRL